ncbi:MAG: DUF1501 domain-containing protein [Singulisphaera sp.]
MDQARREGKPHFGSVIAEEQGRSTWSCRRSSTCSRRSAPALQQRRTRPPRTGPRRRQARRRGRADDPDDVTPERSTAAALLDRFDDWRRAVDGAPVAGLDACYRRAFDLLTSDRVARALDLNREDPRLRERYGVGSPQHLGDGAPMWNDQLLASRRLVEAGARCVTVAYGFWDTHGKNFSHLRRHLPLFDRDRGPGRGPARRGLDRDVSVVVWGEFGRTPTINRNAGRDHWAAATAPAGRGRDAGRPGHRPTDRLGGQAVSTPIHYQDVLATIYYNLGIDPHGFVTIVGRPIPILPSTTRPIAQLIGRIGTGTSRSRPPAASDRSVG